MFWLTTCQQSFDRSRFSSSQDATILTDLLGENNSKLKMAVEMTIPDYHNQSQLPTGVTISLWDDKSTIFNVDKIESRMLHPENYKDMAWAEALEDNVTYWFAAVTMTEYGTMLNTDGRIDKLPGNLRKPGNWEQFIMVPTSEEAMNHTMSNNETALIAIAFDGYNQIHHMSQKKLSSFQRGYSVQVLQVHAPHNYRLTSNEMDNLRVIHLSYNAIDKFDKYNWENGWIWLYGHTMHVRSMLTLPEDSPHHTIFGMALAHLGQFGQSQLQPEVQLALGGYKAERKIDAYHVTIPKRHQRGHPEHSSYIKERDRTIDLEQSEDEEDGKGTKRPRQSSETPDNTIDFMEG